MIKIITVSIICLSVLTSCDHQLNSRAELLEYVNDEDNGVQLKRDNKPFVIEATYIPSAVLLSQESGSYRDRDELVANLARYDSILYFSLRISLNDRKVEENFIREPAKRQAISSYLFEGISEDLMIISGVDSVRPLGVAYEGNFSMATQSSVMVAFPRRVISESSETIMFCFDDRLLGSGKSSFNFKTKDIERVPSIKPESL